MLVNLVNIIKQEYLNETNLFYSNSPNAYQYCIYHSMTACNPEKTKSKVIDIDEATLESGQFTL